MGLMDYMEAYALLNKYGIKSVESRYVSSAREALSFSNGKPIALKALSQRALHKSKNKLVALGISTPDEIESQYTQLAKTASKFKPYRIIAQRMVRGNLEIIIGGKTDPQFGKMVLIGLGGIYVETFKDFALRLCPISEYDARSMLSQLKSRNIIAPNQKSERMIISLMLSVSRMFYDNNMTELDLNPVILHDDTYDAVDLRIIR